MSACTSLLPLSSSFRETYFRTTRYLLWSKLIATQVISTLNLHLNKLFVILSKHALNRITVTDWLLQPQSDYPSCMGSSFICLIETTREVVSLLFPPLFLIPIISSSLCQVCLCVSSALPYSSHIMIHFLSSSWDVQRNASN